MKLPNSIMIKVKKLSTSNSIDKSRIHALLNLSSPFAYKLRSALEARKLFRATSMSSNAKYDLLYAWNKIAIKELKGAEQPNEIKMIYFNSPPNSSARTKAMIKWNNTIRRALLKTDSISAVIDLYKQSPHDSDSRYLALNKWLSIARNRVNRSVQSEDILKILNCIPFTNSLRDFAIRKAIQFSNSGNELDEIEKIISSSIQDSSNEFYFLKKRIQYTETLEDAQRLYRKVSASSCKSLVWKKWSHLSKRFFKQLSNFSEIKHCEFLPTTSIFREKTLEKSVGLATSLTELIKIFNASSIGSNCEKSSFDKILLILR